MNSAAVTSEPPPSSKLGLTGWLIILVAVIGFAFDTYELLMLPLIAGPALVLAFYALRWAMTGKVRPLWLLGGR